MREEISIIKSGITLFFITLIAILLLVTVDSITKPTILLQKELEVSKSLKTVLPQAVKFSEKIVGDKIIYYKGLKENDLLYGYAFISSAKGYSGNIELIAGVDLNGTIQGIKILKHAETPGLGSKINEVKSEKTILSVIKGEKVEEKNIPWFCEQFIGKKISNLEVLKTASENKIQAITGATISSKAVTKAVREGIKKLRQEIK